MQSEGHGQIEAYLSVSVDGFTARRKLMGVVRGGKVGDWLSGTYSVGFASLKAAATAALSVLATPLM